MNKELTLSSKGIETPEILIPALRQYRHNSSGDAPLIAFDYDETVKIVNKIQNQSSGA